MNGTVPLHSLDEEHYLLGPQDSHARMIRNRFGVTLTAHDGRVHVGGEDEAVAGALDVVRAALEHIRETDGLGKHDVQRLLDGHGVGRAEGAPGAGPGRLWLPSGVEPRSPGQERFVRMMQRETVTVAIGPAGTGKTYLAAAAAVTALRKGSFRKLVLVRPAVEAGEHLGFLPGDFVAKINPFLRPLYDALRVHLEPGKLKHLIDNDVIEIAPLAYMRGRTLDEAFIILDEAQNTTTVQMKMFLTRMGQKSKVVVAGDETQIDLPPSTRSGLLEAEGLLRNISGIAVVRLERRDIVRHSLVQKIVNAYGQRDRNGDGSASR